LRTFDLFVLWSSLGVGLLVLAAGDWLVNGYGLNLVELVGVAIVGSIVGSLMLAGAARPGSRHGVPTMVSLRPIVGRVGSFIPSSLNVFQLLGWAAFELLVMALAAGSLLGRPLGEATTLALVPVFGAVVLVLALAGPLTVVRAWLEKFAIWAVFASTALLAAMVALSGHDLGQRPTSSAYLGAGSLMLALDLVIVMPISWWPLVADYNRFAASPRASMVGTVGGYSVSNAAFYVLGGVLVLFAYSFPLMDAPYADFLLGLGLLQLGVFPLLIILVDETDNAFANVYSTAVSVQNLAPRLRQALLVIVATAIATAVALYLAAVGEGIGGSFNNFLILVGGIFVPLLGVVIADAFIVRRSGYRDDEFQSASPKFRWTAFAAWVPASLLYYAVFGGWIPGFPPIGATLPSFALAAALHAVLSFTDPRSRLSDSPAAAAQVSEPR
jgi:putative hydroxymethylpyrimidine transporter CytX